MLSLNTFTSTCLFMFLLCFISKVYSTKLEVQQNSDSAVAELQLRQIYKQTKHMKYGQCWTIALEHLETGCRQLTDDMQRRIAYAFARCHLQSAGRNIPECEPSRSIAECTKEETLKDVAFNTYTEFFTHTQQMCFHLQSQIWHELTEDTISRLADNSADLATSLEEGTLIVNQIVERQNESLLNQQELLRNERLLRDNMLKTFLDSQKSQAETAAMMRRQKALFAEIFNRVSALQKTMLGQFTSIHTFGFYVGSSILAYVLSSTSRTSSSRIWLFILITMNFISERLIAWYLLSQSSYDGDFALDEFVLPDPVYENLWICRKFYGSLGLLTMIACIIRYRDYVKLNNQILNEIKSQNAELQEMLRTSALNSLSGLETPYPNKPVFGDSADCELVPVAMHSVKDDLMDFTNHSIPVVGNSTSVMTSYDSDGDSTYVADDHSRSSGSSFSSYVTTESAHSSFVQSFVRSSTPSRRSLSRRPSASPSVPALSRLFEGSEKADIGVIIGGYNLRRRGRVVYSSAVSGESVESFIESVAKVTMKNKQLLRH